MTFLGGARRLLVVLVAVLGFCVGCAGQPVQGTALPSSTTGWHAATRTEPTNLNWRVPQDWRADGDPVMEKGPGGRTYEGVMQYGVYKCGGVRYVMGEVAATSTTIDPAVTDTAAMLTALMDEYVKDSYDAGTTLTKGTPERFTRSGTNGVLVTGTVRGPAGGSACSASDSETEIGMIGFEITTRRGPELAYAMASAGVSQEPEAPAPLRRGLVRELLNTVTPR